MITGKWLQRYLELAEYISQWSKDPSTKVGAVIVRPDNSVCSVGFNGFPRGVDDDPARYADRELKYKLIVHGEINAMAFTNECLDGYTLFTWPFLPCSRCAGFIIQNKIKTVVAPKLTGELAKRWEESLNLTKSMFTEAGVAYIEIEKTK